MGPKESCMFLDQVQFLSSHAGTLDWTVIALSTKTALIISLSNKVHPYLGKYLTNSLTHGAEPVLRRYQLCSSSRISQHFMEPEGLLSCLQESSTGLHPQPDRSSPYHPIYLRSILILSTHLHLGLPSGLSPSGFPTNILHKLFCSPIRATCHAYHILDLHILIILVEEYKL
jgi:hypothetical protein